MSVKVSQTLVCDRCGFEDKDISPKNYKWAKFFLKENNGPRWAYIRINNKDHTSCDICPDCLEVLYEWWEAGKEEE